MLRASDLKKVSDGPFSKNQHVSVPSHSPINVEEISGCSINSRTWVSVWNFAAKLFAELVPLRLLKCLMECLEMGVNLFLFDMILSPSASSDLLQLLVCPLPVICRPYSRWSTGMIMYHCNHQRY